MFRPLDWLPVRVDSRPFAIARILLGVAAIGKFIIIAPVLVRTLSGDFVQQHYPIQVPVFYNEQAVLVIAFIWFTSSVLFLLGVLTRLSGATLTTVMLYTLLIDQQLYSNHNYLMVLVIALVTLGDSGARFSVDARLAGRKDLIPGWPLTLLKLQLTSVYGFAAITKINQDFFNGVIFEGWMNPAIYARLLEQFSPETIAGAAITTELFLAAGFWFRRTRWVALVVGLGFHLTMVVAIGERLGIDLMVFTIVMAALYLPFFEDLFSHRRAMTAQIEPASVTPEAVGTAR